MTKGKQKMNAVLFDELNYKKAVVTWFTNTVKPSKRSRCRIDLGLCSHGKGVAFVAIYNPNRPVSTEF